jgi:hypothetical protein
VPLRASEASAPVGRSWGGFHGTPEMKLRQVPDPNSGTDIGEDLERLKRRTGVRLSERHYALRPGAVCPAHGRTMPGVVRVWLATARTVA